MDQSLRILVVDDSPDDRFFFCRALLKTGLQVEVLEVEDGNEAIEFLSQDKSFPDAQHPKPDLIFLDLKMPGRDGFDVLRWIQQHKPEPALKVVVLSGSEIQIDMQLAKQLGAADYLVKPAKPEVLRKLICAVQAVHA